jgi:hypothetical protein
MRSSHLTRLEGASERNMTGIACVDNANGVKMRYQKCPTQAEFTHDDQTHVWLTAEDGLRDIRDMITLLQTI